MRGRDARAFCLFRERATKMRAIPGAAREVGCARKNYTGC